MPVRSSNKQEDRQRIELLWPLAQRIGHAIPAADLAAPIAALDGWPERDVLLQLLAAELGRLDRRCS